MRYFSLSAKSIITALIAFYLASCATITVNVYFPAEEVRQAYTNLEEEFLIDKEKPSQENKKDKDNKPKAGSNQGSRLTYPEKPLIKVTKVVPLTQKLDLDIVNKARAGEDITQQIESEIKKFPEVIQAFKSRASRQSSVNDLLNSGKVGEGKDGMLVPRDTLSASEKNVMSAENNDRKTIIQGMAKAIIKINNIETSSQNISKVYPEAAEQFATSRRSVAQSGWKVQLPNGQWATKR
jgi:hypothetical protein